MSRRFWLFIVVLLALMLALEYQVPRRFVWNPTFAHNDRQPFGCYVLDSMLTTAMPHGYTVCRKSLSQLALQDTTPRSIIILTNYARVNADTAMALATRGCRLLIASESFTGLEDTLHTDLSFAGRFRLDAIQNLKPRRDSIFWTADSARYTPATFRVYRQLISSHVYADSITCEPLAEIHELYDLEDPGPVTVSKAVAVSFPVGRGEIIIVGTPLLLTNYGMLDCPAYVYRLVNRLKDLPVVRTEAYMPHYDVAESSPLRELLKRPPLRWALYLILTGLVLLMTLNARRRQRAIPVEKPPRNYQLDFIRHIGTLLYQKSHKPENKQ